MRLNVKYIFFCSLMTFQVFSVSAAEKDDLSSMNLDCVINPSKVASLGVKSPGLIKQVLVERSDMVEAGALLATLNNEVETAALNVAMARYQATKTEIKLRKTSIDLAQRQYARSLDAFNGDALSKHDLDVSETELELAKIQYAQAIAKQKIELKELARARMILARKKMTAPFSGVVLERYKTEGELVNDEPLLKVAQLNPLYVEVILSADYLKALKVGMKAEVWGKDQSDKPWEATIVQVDQIIDAASSTFGARLELQNNNYEIPAGLQCQVHFSKQAKKVANKQ